jgi:hypothetical protein
LPSSVTGTTSITRWRCSAAHSGWGPARASPGYAPNERIVARARELAAASGGRLLFDHDPKAVVPRCGGRLHGRMDVDGPGGRDRGAA